MTAAIVAIYRYPVKGLGDEALERVTLAPDAHVPGDRRWAVAHGGSAWDAAARAWVARRNFVQTAHTPELARLVTSLDGDRVTVSAPDREPITARPDDAAEAALLSAWLEGVAGHRQPGPYQIARLPDGALTDVADAHVSLLSDASLRALSERAGKPLERRRFRGNLWIDGLAPWEEFDLVGREIVLNGAAGPVRLRVTERIERCAAPSASPKSGHRDVDVVPVLRAAYGHADFGVYAQVVSGGEIALGASLSR
ncbi:MAG: MOSC domain-containing protein [Pikeienuella sp.]